MKTLENFLKKHQACEYGFDFAKDLTLEEFLETCPRGSLILWLFSRTNPESKREMILAAGHCANTVRHLMEDDRSLNAVDMAIAFGEGRATKEELKIAARAAADAVAYADARNAARIDAARAACNAALVDDLYAAARAAPAAADAAAYAGYAANWDSCKAVVAINAAYDAELRNQKLTADICRKYLPLKIWNQKEI